MKNLSFVIGLIVMMCLLMACSSAAEPVAGEAGLEPTESSSGSALNTVAPQPTTAEMPEHTAPVNDTTNHEEMAAEAYPALESTAKLLEDAASDNQNMNVVDTEQGLTSAGSVGIDEMNDEEASQARIEDDAVIVYEWIKGMKGIGPSKYVWRMYPDGRIISSDGRSWQVDPEEIVALQDEINNLGFFEVEKSDSTDEGVCCDNATYVLTVLNGDQVFKATAVENSPAPAAVTNSAEIINNYLMSLPQ